MEFFAGMYTSTISCTLFAGAFSGRWEGSANVRDTESDEGLPTVRVGQVTVVKLNVPNESMSYFVAPASSSTHYEDNVNETVVPGATPAAHVQPAT